METLFLYRGLLHQRKSFFPSGGAARHVSHSDFSYSTYNIITDVPGLAGPSRYRSKEVLLLLCNHLLRVFIMVHGSGDGFYARLFPASPSPSQHRRYSFCRVRTCQFTAIKYQPIAFTDYLYSFSSSVWDTSLSHSDVIGS